MKNWHSLLPIVFFIVLCLFASAGLILDIKDKRNASCEEFKNVPIERLPARCVKYFSK